MPFKEGNQEGRSKGLYQSALKRALARASKSVDGGLNDVTDKLVASALDGEQWAIKEIADRIDGRPAQSVTVGGDEENPLVIKKVVDFVSPTTD